MQAGGGGGAGSSGVHNGAGGGAGAAAFLIINIGKLQSIRFNAGRGGAAGQKSIDANTHRHGGDGADSTIVMKLWNGDTLKAYVEGGSGGLAYSSNAGAGREGGTGGRAMVFVESSRSVNLTASISDTDLTSVNYVGIKADGTKLNYPDTNYEAVFYVLKVFKGGDGAADDATLSSAITSPLFNSQVSIPFYPNINHIIKPLTQLDHSYGTFDTSGLYGGDGGYSVHGYGGLCSLSYISPGAVPIWTDA